MTMETLTELDIASIAGQLNLPVQGVTRAIELLDDGNTIAFITRYRRDQTGGLQEDAIRAISQARIKARALEERRQAILKSIETKGQLTPELSERIQRCKSARILEDLYLPFKTKKRSRATLARERGLGPLATEVLEAGSEIDIIAKATQFVDAEKELPTTDSVIGGVRDLLVEHFSESLPLRQLLRRKFRESAVLRSKRLEEDEASEESVSEEPVSKEPVSEEPVSKEPVTEEPASEEPVSEEPVSEIPASETPVSEEKGEECGSDGSPDAESPPSATGTAETVIPQFPQPSKISPPPGKLLSPADLRRIQRKELRSKKRKRVQAAFKDYFAYEESLSKVPPHRVLALNRGERFNVLRVKIEVDMDELHAVAVSEAVSENHPHASFLHEAVREAVGRSIFPSLEREARRDLTEKAESHALGVFSRNLRSLLLQPPVKRRVLAMDPGFRSGCKLVALDEFGDVLEHALIHIVGSEPQLAESRKAVCEIVDRHRLNAFAIGNGTACRETEQFVAGLIEGELNDREIAYVIVNEAGASIYSTSVLAGEELPQYDATLRGAISIGRRLLDPLSELVKIDPGNIGVGMYQHDVRPKPLKETLDEVVESCVNYVGVNLNTASPALLRYVSGLNQLTARNIFQYRQENGPFVSREQLKDVAGVGENTYVQAAGFLKVLEADNPLDATWIHPESYEAAQKLLARFERELDDVRRQLPESSRAAEEKPGDTSPPEAVVEQSPATPQSLPVSERPAPLETLVRQLSESERENLVTEIGGGPMLISDLCSALDRPARDPRADLPPPVFRKGIVKLVDLEKGMELSGTVLNVIDFGAFVDIGLNEPGLVHISRLADRYIRDPHEVVSVGDVLRIWIVDIDKVRRRVSLTAVEPGTEKPRTSGGHAGEREGRREAAGGRARGGHKEVNSDAAGQPGQPRSRGQNRPAPTGQARSGGGGERGGERGSRSYRGKRGSSSGGDGRGSQSTPSTPRYKKPPPPPITEDMKKGKEPMRTFGDLQQFFSGSQQETPEPKKKQHKKKPPKKKPLQDELPEQELPQNAPPQLEPPHSESPQSDPPVEGPGV